MSQFLWSGKVSFACGFFCVCLWMSCNSSINCGKDYLCFIVFSLLHCQRSVQFTSVTQLCLTLQSHGLKHARFPCPSPTPRAYAKSCPLCQWCHPTISSSVVPFSPAFNLFQHLGLFQWVGSCIRWPKYWSFSFSISLSNEHSGLIFRMDWLDLHAVQGTLKSILQHHNLKASILCHLAFFKVQLSHPYMTTGETIALTRWTFVGKVMSLLFHMQTNKVLQNSP